MSSLDELLHKQNQIAHSIERSLINFKKMGQAKMTIATTRNRISILKEAYIQLQDLDAKICAIVDLKTKASLQYFTDNQFVTCEEIYMETLDYMSEVLSTVSPPETTNSNVSHSSSNSSRPISHLPRIQLPTFDGTFETWESFRDKFQSMVISEKSLTDVERLHFLCTSLKGEAGQAISHLAITENNFKVAWQITVSRYDNKRRLIMTHLSRLFSLPQVTYESAKELRNLRDRITASTQALRNLARPVDQWSDIIVFLGTQKLDKSSRKAWEFKFENVNEFPNYTEFDTFLESRIRALEAMVPVKSENPNDGTFKPLKSKSLSTHTATATNIVCPMCKQSHLLYQCQQFLTRTPSERYDFIKSQKRCVNCFSVKHTVEQCQNHHHCKECKRNHHTLLHFPIKPNSSRKADSPSVSSSHSDGEIASNVVSHASTLYGVLLSTARVQVHSQQGRSITVRGLLDQGSVATLITEKLAQSLRLHRSRQQIRVTGIGETNSIAHHTAEITITPSNENRPAYATQAVILKNLTRYVPPRRKVDSNWSHISGVKLADWAPMSSDPIDIIIGADVYSQLILDGVRRGSQLEPIAQNTALGWILSGPVSSSPIPNSIEVHHSTTLETLDQTLRQFWELETFPSQTSLTPDEERCEHHFQKTHSRQRDGRYVVRFPFKSEPPIALGDSRSAALRSLHRIERRFEANPIQASMYKDFMSEYETLGHMIRVPSDQTNPASQRYYIPHHAVFRDGSSTTRLRVVFNASCRTTNGKSLNDHLFSGPKLQRDLISILLRWRQFLFVYTADIAKMYRQIRIHPQDVDYQRILWRYSPDKPIDEYQLLTVTYGTTSAPYQALRGLNQLVQDEGAQFPLGTPILQEQTYVDDCLFGADSFSSLRQMRNQVQALLNKGGFRLRKWASNNSSLLEDIDPSDHGLATSKTLQMHETVPILGIEWNPMRDTFQFRVSTQTDPCNTKRAVLSTIARLYDPLGWITPAITSAKTILQQLWSARCDWDDVLPEHLQNDWQNYLVQLPELELLHIQRKLAPGKVATQSLHGFSDASSKAYAAVVYIRSVLHDGTVSVALLIAKSRVAPLKQISVPRLELCAALLLARLVAFVRNALHSRQYECHCWTDSTITLSWLAQPPTRWKTFVANRVSKIQTLLPDAQWHHVSTHENPADCASRGMLPKSLRLHELWWFGPAWFKQAPSHWPVGSMPFNSDAAIETRCVHANSLVCKTDPFNLPTRYSSWPKLLRVTAYLIRFIERLRAKCKGQTLTIETTPTSLVLAPAEITKAKIVWLKRIQADSFPDELQQLSSKGTIPKTSPLAALVPYLDSNELIRAKGRLSQSQLPENAKRPFILRSHPILTMIISHTHTANLHSGPQLTLANLRQEYWILRARATVRSVLYNCVACARERAAIQHELMGDLPACRITKVAKPFTHTGVDYAGPIQVRTASGRGHKSQKAYIAVFICMTIKAIHLEVVSDYSTKAFVAAFHRFVSRRGLPQSMYSDNGTTFQGADRELTENFKAIVRDVEFQNKFAIKGVAWHFLPPAAPHFGGLWEAAVKSVKHHLKRCIGSHTLTYEELSTFLCQVEACLNSRPIAPSSDCIDDYNVLTPGHFLIGSALTAIPEPSIYNVKETRLSRWQLVQQLTEGFWRMWSNDYLHTLHQRPKWRVTQGLTKVGQIVLLRNSNTPPCKWEIGRIVACHPGDDGLVRVVTIKTAQSEFKRPITKLCFLPVPINESDERTHPSLPCTE